MTAPESSWVPPAGENWEVRNKIPVWPPSWLLRDPDPFTKILVGLVFIGIGSLIMFVQAGASLCPDVQQGWRDAVGWGLNLFGAGCLGVGYKDSWHKVLAAPLGFSTMFFEMAVIAIVLGVPGC